MILASGVIGYARVGGGIIRRRRGRWLLAAIWMIAAVACLPGLGEIITRMSRIPHPIRLGEAAQIWSWIDQVGPEDGVLAAYEVTAPLSSRKRLFSDVLDQNKPSGFPQLGPEFHWVFLKNQGHDPKVYVDQGFQIVMQGEFLTILRRTLNDVRHLR
jgi:hypothetical protein